MVDRLGCASTADGRSRDPIVAVRSLAAPEYISCSVLPDERDATQALLPRAVACDRGALRGSVQLPRLLGGRQEVRLLQDQRSGAVAVQHARDNGPLHRIDGPAGCEA